MDTKIQFLLCFLLLATFLPQQDEKPREIKSNVAIRQAYREHACATKRVLCPLWIFTTTIVQKPSLTAHNRHWCINRNMNSWDVELGQTHMQSRTRPRHYPRSCLLLRLAAALPLCLSCGKKIRGRHGVRAHFLRKSRNANANHFMRQKEGALKAWGRVYPNHSIPSLEKGKLFSICGRSDPIHLIKRMV